MGHYAATFGGNVWPNWHCEAAVGCGGEGQGWNLCAWQDAAASCGMGWPPDIENSLLDAGADMEVEDDWGMTPLQKAAREGHTEIVNLLVNAGADITKKKNFHWGTPLHLAAQKGHTEIVKVLLDVGVDISREIGGMFIPVCERFYKDWQDDDGATPLHLAAKEGHIEIVKLLLDAGASTYIKNNNGESPEDLVTGTWRRFDEILFPGYKPYQDIKKLLNYTWLQRFSARADV